ncbi:MAG: hypothetical protein KBS95_04890 [Alistipes sp.]|nr:hypothetical protein [Candidatus Alistipes equi]
MKKIKLFAVALLSFTLCFSSQVKASEGINLGSVASALTSSNGLKAGTALLSLYTEYKSTGTIDLKNLENIQKILTIAQNIKGLKDATPKTNTTDFVSGLISGSKNLVTQSNSSTVLEGLKSLANVDVSSLANSAATSASKSALSKLAGAKATASEATQEAASSATSILTSLFSALK